MKTSKELIAFVKSHEKRFFVSVDYYGNIIDIKKAYKVELADEVRWVYFNYGNPHILSAKQMKTLTPTREDAMELAEIMRREREARRKKEAEANKKILDKAASILHDRHYYITDKNGKVKDEYKEIYDEAASMVYRYGYKPDESEELRQCVAELKHYIRTGMIYSQGRSFTKDSVARIEYGKESMKIIFADGSSIIPKEESTMCLLMTIFGQKLDGWYFEDVIEPMGEKDQFKRC